MFIVIGRLKVAAAALGAGWSRSWPTWCWSSWFRPAWWWPRSPSVLHDRPDRGGRPAGAYPPDLQPGGRRPTALGRAGRLRGRRRGQGWPSAWRCPCTTVGGRRPRGCLSLLRGAVAFGVVAYFLDDGDLKAVLAWVQASGQAAPVTAPGTCSWLPWNSRSVPERQGAVDVRSRCAMAVASAVCDLGAGVGGEPDR